MPIEHVETLTRDEMRAHPEKLFLFGDNRERYGGTYRAIREEPNARGVRVKHNPRKNDQSYYSDDDYERCVKWIDEDLVYVEQWLGLGRIVVIPDDLFLNRVRLTEKAPRVADYLAHRLMDLEGQWPQTTIVE